MATTTPIAQVGDVGTGFVVQFTDENGTVLDISGATTKQIIFQRPDGTDLIATAVFVTNGVDGQAMYVTQANDLNQDGTWKIQGYVVLPNGSWHTQTGKFKVKANL